VLEQHFSAVYEAQLPMLQHWKQKHVQSWN